MKAFAFSVLAIVGISAAAAVILERYQRTVDSAFVGSGARPDPEPKLHGGEQKAAPKG